MLQIMFLEPLFPTELPTVRFTLLLFTPVPLILPNSTMTDTHDKELLVIFEAFKHWQQYFKGSRSPIDVITDYKNLEYLLLQKSLPTAKPTGQSIFPNLI